jgi:hypothetical protein
MWRRVAILRTDISKERIASMIRAKKIYEPGKTLVANVVPSWFFSPWWWKRYIPPKCRLLQEPYGVTFQKTAFVLISFCIVSCTSLSLLLLLFHFSNVRDPDNISFLPSPSRALPYWSVMQFHIRPHSLLRCSFRHNLFGFPVTACPETAFFYSLHNSFTFSGLTHDW